jgi:hypothetical protein
MPIPGVTAILVIDPLKSGNIDADHHLIRSSHVRIIDAGTSRRPAIRKDADD